MKKRITLGIIVAVTAIMSSVRGNAQIAQFQIGNASGGNEHASKIRYLQDGSMVIAGYTYTSTGSKAFVMRCDQTGIIWQETLATSTGSYNQVFDMIITHDNDIVVVGSFGAAGVYQTNRAGIVKLNYVNGNIIWQDAYYDTANTTGGEIFFGVTEMTQNSDPLLSYALVAVGTWNYTPATCLSMVTVFSSAGAYLYNEVCSTSGEADENFTSVVRPTGSNSVNICGIYNPGGTKNIRLMQYTPHHSFGIINWDEWGHFTQVGSNGANLTYNYPNAAYAYGNSDTILLTGESLNAYDSSHGATAESPFVISFSASTGAIHYVRQLKNGKPASTWANDCSIAEENPDHIFTSELPYPNFVNSNDFETGVSVNPVITEVTSLNNLTATTPITLDNSTGTTGIYSMLDIKLNSTATDLAMVGIMNINTIAAGSHDIYLATTKVGGSQFFSQGCDTLHDSIAIRNISWTALNKTPELDSVILDSITITKTATNLAFKLFCGDTITQTGRQSNPDEGLGTAAVSKSNEINIYPNPTTYAVTVSSEGTNINQVQVIDVNGKKVGDYSFENTKSANISLANLPPGTYLLRINNATSKLIIKTN